MSRKPLILDIETKYTFRDYSDHQKLGVTVAATYDYTTEKSKVFLESELSDLFRLMESASYVVGYNVRGFDLPVLQAYYMGDVTSLPVFDILDDIKNIIGRRIALNDVVSATLNEKKSAMGLMAIDFYKEGKIEELKQYCLDDVMLTKKIFDYGIDNQQIHYRNENGKVNIPVSWKRYMQPTTEQSTIMSLPF